MPEVLFKRLNVITQFETQVDRALQNEDYPLNFSGRSRSSRDRDAFSGFGVTCAAVKKPVELNQLEMDYIVKHFNMRKSYTSSFVQVADIKEGKKLGKFTAFAKLIMDGITAHEESSNDDFYFVVMRSKY